MSVGTVRDRGLQAERTTLAWSRTALSLAGLSVLVARSLLAQVGVAVAVLALAVTFVAAAAMLGAQRRYRRWTVVAGQAYRPGVANAALAALVTLLAIAVLGTWI